jgi:predicted tellurium resistance membrane protein TerC
MDLSIFLEAATWLSILTLTFMEVVLGIDNIIFISITAGKLPSHQQARARRLGLLCALVFRILLLLSIKWIIGLKEPLFHIFGYGVSGRSIILIGGGLFLLAKSTMEIHHKIERSHAEEQVHQGGKSKKSSFNVIVLQIILLDIVFSFDSILTAVGLTPHVLIMITAVILSMMIMLAFSGPVSHFINKHPTLQILALSFLILIGLTLILEGMPEDLGIHISKGYIYFAIFFSLTVEFLNIRFRSKIKKQ